jgi:hypothetical protein
MALDVRYLGTMALNIKYTDAVVLTARYFGEAALSAGLLVDAPQCQTYWHNIPEHQMALNGRHLATARYIYKAKNSKLLVKAHKQDLYLNNIYKLYLTNIFLTIIY